ncbi:MAG: molybdopterin-dependent oxidoreductase [Burkholderiaceae bacterium]
MDKRRFLVAGAFGAALPLRAQTLPAATSAATARTGPGLLTVAGAIGRGNRGPLDPAFDPLLVKHSTAAFDRAHVFDAAMLARLPVVTIKPTLEYDAKVHSLAGPLLSAVVGAAGVAPGAKVNLGLRALDGYTVAVSLADADRYRMIVATTFDGVPMSLGGLGPQWAVYDADRLVDFKDKPLKERFGLCPWGLYFIEVKNL